jgi:hypothetical protein
MKHEPQNLPRTETYHVSAGGLARVFMLEQPEPLKHIPIETCNVLKVVFQPHAPIFHVPHAIPIHEVLHLFQLSHNLSNLC